MKTPLRMTPEESLVALQAWTREHVADSFFGMVCKHCRSKIQYKNAKISIHIKEFTHCAGSGTVRTLAIPFCARCEPEPEDSGCMHLPIAAERTKKVRVVRGEGQKAAHADSVIGCEDWPEGCTHTPKCEPQNEGARVLTEILRKAEVRSPQALAADKDVWIVCMRVTNPAYVDGAKMRVASCKHEVWMAPSTQQIMDCGASYDRVICTECMEKKVEQDGHGKKQTADLP